MGKSTRCFGVVCCFLISLSTATSGQTPPAQVSVPAQRITGDLLSGGRAAFLSDLVAMTDVNKICAKDSSNQRGRYLILIPARAPDCVRSRSEDRPLTFVFVLAGENIGSMSEATVSLDKPETLGATKRLNLNFIPIPGLDSENAPQDNEILYLRFVGQLRLGTAAAPDGTQIDVALAGTANVGGGAVMYKQCATGWTRVGGGFWVDVKISSGCVRKVATEPPLSFIFFVNGERVGTAAVANPHLADLTSLGRRVHVNLRGTR